MITNEQKMKNRENKRRWNEKNKEYFVRYNKEHRERINECKRKWERNHKDESRVIRKKYYENNKENIKKRSKKWNINIEAREKSIKRWKENNVGYGTKYYRKNKVRLNERRRINRKNNLNQRLNDAVRTKITKSLHSNKNGRHWEGLVGYSLRQLKNHLEKQFTPEMDWDNYGSYWHIDHITPKSWYKFNLFEDKQFKLCWSLKNLRPLKAKYNLSKNNRLVLEV